MIRPKEIPYIIKNEEYFKRLIQEITTNCLEKLSIFALEKSEIDYYITHYLKPYILIKPIYWYTNPLVKLIKEHVGNELPASFLYLIKETEENLEFQKKIEKEKSVYKLKILKKEDITEEDIENLMALIEIGDFVKEETVLNYIINKITNRKINNHIKKTIFFKFIKLYIKKNNLDIVVYEKNIADIKGKTVYAQVKEKFGRTCMNFNSKVLNSDISIVNIIFTFFHELWHLLQFEEEYTDLYYRTIFKMDKLLCEIKPEYENNNYYKLSFENDAHLNGAKLLYQYFKNINNETIDYETIIKNIEELKKQRDNLTREDHFGNQTYLDVYFDNICKNRGLNPYELGFIHTYNEKGERLTPLELYRKRNENTEFYDKIIENSNYTIKDLEKIIQELEEALKNETEDIKNIITIYNIYTRKYAEAIGESNEKDKNKLTYKKV